MDQRNWARITVIILHGLSILFDLMGILVGLLLFSPEAGNDPALGICRNVIGMGVSGYILYWFSANGKYFRR